MIVRLARVDDAAGVRAIYAPIIESTAISFEVAVPSVDEVADRIDGHPDHPWLAAEENGEVVGYAYAAPFSDRAAYDWSVTTSIYVAAGERGRSLGRALYTSLLSILTGQGHRQAMAGITLPNAASVALHEGFGFSPVGIYRAVGWKLGAWHDVGWWQRPLGPAGEPPGIPVPLHAMPEPAIAAALAAGEQLLRSAR